MTDRDLLAEIATSLARIAGSAERLSGAADDAALQLREADAYHWEPAGPVLHPVERFNGIPLELLKGVDDVKDILLRNTLQFARGHGANNVLLWGARGMGKSSLVKAVHAHVAADPDRDLHRLVLIEINREDIGTLPVLMRAIAKLDAQFVVFCDDLSFDAGEATYKSLKTILDGGLEGRPQNTLFYATSNRRHLMPRDMIENERLTAINPGEAIEEKISLSDRFGLWLGFHQCDQDTFLNMVRAYVAHYGLEIADEDLARQAIEWSATRGSRSGRVAIQFVRQLAGEQGKAL